MADSGEKIDVRGDGRIVLYKRAHLKRPKWQARISVPNATGYKVISTKTANLDEAKLFAIKLYEQLYMQVMAGGALNTKTFKQVFQEWKEHASTTGTTQHGGSWDATIQRLETYAVPYFGLKRIDQIKEADFVDYWSHRKATFNRRAPTNSTLRRERTSILPVFKFALAKGYIGKIPETHAPKAKNERRPTFSWQEWKVIREASREWVKDGLGLATWRDRFMAQNCFLVLAHSGIRIGELRNLRWRDLVSDRRRQSDGTFATYLSAHVRGKTGTRQAMFQPGIEVCLKKIYLQRCRELELANPDAINPRPDPSEIIFCHPDGRAIVEYKHALLSLLEFAGVPVELDGKARTVYSLRHLYATRQLSREASPFLLAKQMGTSVEMLEKHYGQVITGKLAAEITKSGPSDIEVRGDVEFPF